MREQMFKENQFDAAVFIGGMQGIVDEFHLFTSLQPNAASIPIFSTGGAVERLASSYGSPKDDLMNDLDYVRLFHKRLGIDVREQRYQSPDKQPAEVSDRLWNRDVNAGPKAAN
jgi:hypothetical protein